MSPTLTPAAAIDLPATAYAATTLDLAPQPRLEGALRADVCVLGAGLTGLSAALELAESGLDVVVLEAKRVAWGASGRSGGQAIFGFGCDQAKIAALVGLEESRRLFDWSLEGVAMIRERRERHGIDCDWRDGHAHVPIKPRQVDELKAWQADLARDYGYPLQWWDRDRLREVLASERYLGALFDPRSGHLNPLKYTLGLARAALDRGVRIFEASPVTQLQRGARPVLRTAHGEVSCDHAVLAGNAYVHGVAPELESRVMPVGTYIGATAPLGERADALIANGMAVADVNWALDYFRLSRDRRLLFGGRASYSTLPPPNLPGWIRMSPSLWGFLARVWWWFFNHHEGQETRVQAELRAEQAAQALIARAEAGQDVLVLAHGYFNHMVGRRLKADGWKLVHNQGYKYWSQRRYEKR